MGLLDDAIREHLELKRRSGADPGEIARLEQEALGPARREAPAPAPQHDVTEPEGGWHAHEGSAHYDDAPLYEHVHEEAPAYEPEPAYEAEPAPVAEPEPVYEPRPAAHEHDQPTEQFSLGDLEEAHEAHAPTAPAHEEPPPAGPGPEDDEAAEIVPADEEPGEDDVLEETPEFLQETPEHDRLWFEQRPPRDFDF
jgi:hypothetical protein